MQDIQRLKRFEIGTILCFVKVEFCVEKNVIMGIRDSLIHIKNMDKEDSYLHSSHNIFEVPGAFSLLFLEVGRLNIARDIPRFRGHQKRHIYHKIHAVLVFYEQAFQG